MSVLFSGTKRWRVYKRNWVPSVWIVMDTTHKNSTVFCPTHKMAMQHIDRCLHRERVLEATLNPLNWWERLQNKAYDLHAKLYK